MEIRQPTDAEIFEWIAGSKIEANRLYRKRTGACTTISVQVLREAADQVTIH